MPDLERIYRGTPSDRKHVEQMRELVRASREMLKEVRTPDIFLGRQKYPPFPKEDDSK